MKIKQRNSKPKKKEQCGKRVKVFLVTLEWSIYIGFCILAFLFVKDVLNQFHAKETFMGQSLKPISKLPTISFCLNTNETISEDDLIVQSKDTEGEFKTLTENKTLHFETLNETIALERMTHHCFKINATTNKIKHKYREFMVITSKNTSSIDVYYTSEENSYGIFKKEWFDGKVFERNIKPGHQVKVYLEPREYMYLNHDDQCSPKTFLDQWRTYLQPTNFSKCPCSFYPFLATDEIEFCGWKVTLDAVRSNFH